MESDWIYQLQRDVYRQQWAGFPVGRKSTRKMPQRGRPLRGNEPKVPFNVMLRESYFHRLRETAQLMGLSQPQFVELLLDRWDSGR